MSSTSKSSSIRIRIGYLIYLELIALSRNDVYYIGSMSKVYASKSKFTKRRRVKVTKFYFRLSTSVGT